MNSNGELEFNLVCQGDTTEEWERKKILAWNSKPDTKKIVKTMGFCDNYKGEIYIFMEDGKKIEYTYSMDPRGVRKDTQSIRVNDKPVGIQYTKESLTRFIENYGSLCVGAARFSEEIPDYSWIKVKRFREENYPTLEEKYEALKKHHEEEVNFLINWIKEKENDCIGYRSRGERGS